MLEKSENSLDSINLIHIKLNKFKCNIKEEIVSDNLVIEAIFNFEFNFPILMKFLNSFQILLNNSFEKLSKDSELKLNESNLKENNEESNIILDDLLKNLVSDNLKLLENSFDPLFKKEWDELDVYFEGKTKIHTIIVLIFTHLEVSNVSKNLLSDYDRNVCMWAALLHDIAKHVKLNDKLSEIFENRGADKLHPFKSAAVALKIFLNKNILKFEDEGKIEELLGSTYQLLIESAVLVPNKKNESRYKISFNNLDKIIENLEIIHFQGLNNKFVVDVIILILFHQSLPNCLDHMNSPLLHKDKIKLIFNFRRIELMRILMINDSASHSLFSSKSFCQEINENIDKIKLIL